MKEKRNEVTPHNEREIDGTQGAIMLLFVCVCAIAVGIVLGIVLVLMSGK